jgi:hypothetical protein
MVTDALFKTSIPIPAFMKVKFFMVTFVALLTVMSVPVVPTPAMNVLAVSFPMMGTSLMAVMGPV